MATAILNASSSYSFQNRSKDRNPANRKYPIWQITRVFWAILTCPKTVQGCYWGYMEYRWNRHCFRQLCLSTSYRAYNFFSNLQKDSWKSRIGVYSWNCISWRSSYFMPCDFQGQNCTEFLVWGRFCIWLALYLLGEGMDFKCYRR